MHKPFDGNTPNHFEPDEEQKIRKAIMTDGAALLCPRCNGTLKSASPGGRVSHVEVWELYCDDCHRCVIVEDTLHL